MTYKKYRVGITLSISHEIHIRGDLNDVSRITQSASKGPGTQYGLDSADMGTNPFHVGFEILASNYLKFLI